MSTVDSRTNSIIHWLTHTLKLDIQQFEPASSDASFRRYFRVTHSQGQQIVMDAPPEKENTEPFIRLANLFKKSGINVPTIYQQDLEQGFLLLEDFGSSSFLDQLNIDTAFDLYSSAFNSLITLQTKIPTSTNNLPHYDQALLNRELDIFYDWFLQQHLALSIPDSIKNTLNQVLITSALEQPRVCVHRDFHSRNLMVLAENSPGIIDFQDAVIGPITYDLVSLLRDCYISWPDEKVNQWMTLYFQQITDLGIINTDPATFSRWFDLMGLQRHLKAIGIFTRLHFRDDKSHYLKDIPRTMSYVSQICKKHPELSEFNQYLKETVLVAYNNQIQ
ncbi:MAG: phosphotransferase [Methylococcales bacterium]|nr:phosphotransferase [Methylococcales bacterium]